MSDPKRPADKAKESLQRGFSEVFRAAKSAGQGIKKELDKGGLGKTIEDSGKELLRAATNVATYVGAELHTWGTKAQETLDPRAPSAHAPPPADVPFSGAPSSGAPPGRATTAAEWPTSRDDFERRFGKVAGDWPRSPEEFERRFGYTPTDKAVGPTPRDPGFRIATDDDPK